VEPRQAPCKSLKGVFGYFFRLEKVTEKKLLFLFFLRSELAHSYLGYFKFFVTFFLDEEQALLVKTKR
jgi:hypothetical protein